MILKEFRLDFYILLPSSLITNMNEAAITRINGIEDKIIGE